MQIGGQKVYDPAVDVVALRAQVGMVFQKPNPFPKSVSLKMSPMVCVSMGLPGSKSETADRVEWSLKSAGLWDEVADRLDQPGNSLSGGQQQRLCIARTVAVEPKVILMDEPCSALDPDCHSQVIEDLIDSLRKSYTIVIVTHSMQQAARISQRTAFFHLGKLIEVGATEDVFTNPAEEQTQNYITGRIG